MTRQETGKVMNLLTAAYPRYYAGIDGIRRENALNMWASIFADDDLRLVLAAVKSFIEGDEKGFPPVPGQIKAKMRLIMEPDQMSEMEAWTLVSKALRNSTYGAREEFEKFPPIVKRIVGNPSQLREWGLMDSETVHSVVASNFQRSYKAIAAKEREVGKLPPDVKQFLESLRLTQNTMPELPKKPGPPPEPTEADVPNRKDVRGWLAELLEKAGFPPKQPPQTTHRSREDVIAILRGENNP